MNKYLAILLLTLSTLSLGTPAYADFQEGLDAYKRNDYATAFKEWKPLAEQGDANAQYNLGLLYDNGQGFIQDYIRAHMWWNVAASEGNENAASSRDNLAKEMTPEDISKAQDMARECVSKNHKGC
jgi:TPR repeat protein